MFLSLCDEKLFYFWFFLIYNRMMEKREIFGSWFFFGGIKLFYILLIVVYVGFYINFVLMICLIGSIFLVLIKDDMLVNIFK